MKPKVRVPTITSNVEVVYYDENIVNIDFSILKILQMLWDALDMNNFYFLFLLFSDFIGILFSFSFLLDDEEARDTAVT